MIAITQAGEQAALPTPNYTGTLVKFLLDG
jgi:hypothetical protein